MLCESLSTSSRLAATSIAHCAKSTITCGLIYDFFMLLQNLFAVNNIDAFLQLLDALTRQIVDSSFTLGEGWGEVDARCFVTDVECLNLGACGNIEVCTEALDVGIGTSLLDMTVGGDSIDNTVCTPFTGSDGSVCATEVGVILAGIPWVCIVRGNGDVGQFYVFCDCCGNIDDIGIITETIVHFARSRVPDAARMSDPAFLALFSAISMLCCLSFSPFSREIP